MSIAAEVEPEIKAAAKERMVAAHASPGKLPELGAKGTARDKTAAVTGMKPRSLAKAQAVVAAREQSSASSCCESVTDR